MKVELKENEVFLYGISMDDEEMKKSFRSEEVKFEVFDNDLIRENATEKELELIESKAKELLEVILSSVNRHIEDLAKETKE